MAKRVPPAGKKEWRLLDPNKKYPKWIEWVRDYGYYYKGWFAVVAVVTVIVLCFAYLVTYQGADMRVYLVTSDANVDEENYYALLDNINYYVYDIDGDQNALMRNACYLLTDDPQTPEQKDVAAKIDEAIADEETVAFIVDDAGYEYIRSRMQLRELSFYGVVAEDKYRFPISQTKLFEGVELGDGRDYYVVMRYVEADKYAKDFYLSGRTDLWVGMMLNNDLSEENNVAISKK